MNNSSFGVRSGTVSRTQGELMKAQASGKNVPVFLRPDIVHQLDHLPLNTEG